MEQKRILLIAPNAGGLEDKLAYPPLGLMYVAANMGSEWEPEIKIMTDDNFDKFGYRYYGISVHSAAVVGKARKIIASIKAANPGAEIYLGGAAAGLIRTDDSSIKIYRGEFEQYVMNTNNLDKIRFPARELVPYDMIHYTGNVHHSNALTLPIGSLSRDGERGNRIAATTMIATRGCVFNCNFCDRETFGRKFRKRSTENVCAEIEHLINDYGIGWIRFCDDCMTLHRDWFMEMCAAVKNYSISWTCMSRADKLDLEMLDNMREAGCREIFFGFESGNQTMLERMNKQENVMDYRNALRMCRQAGITSCAYILFGFPGEDEGTVEDTINFLEQEKPDKARLSEFVPFPGCDVGNHPGKYDVELLDGEYWYYDNPGLSLRYKHMKDETMLSLRETMRDYFETNYRENWTK